MRLGQLPLHNRDKIATIFLLAGSLIFFIYTAFYFGLASYPIVDMNEGLYAEIAREMLASGNFLIPHLNHVPYLEKPPLLYWLIALSFKVFGSSTFAARLIPATAGASVCVGLILFMRRLQQQTIGWLAAIILASSLGVIIISRIVFFDMLLTAFLTFALCSFYFWYRYEKSSWLYLSYVGVALAFMTKGAIAIVLCGGIAMSFMLIQKTPLAKLMRFFNPIGIGLFLLITIPWHVLASMHMRGFAWDYFINEQVYRFLNIRIPHDYHTGPIYFYLPRIIIYLLPWALLIPALLQREFRKITLQDPLLKFAWIWLLLPLLFFSLSSAKGDYYMIVSMPALALLIAARIKYDINQNKPFMLSMLFTFFSIALLAAAVYLLWAHKMPINADHLLKTFSITLLIYTIIGIYLVLHYRKPLLSFILTAGLAFPLINFYIQFEKITQNTYSQKSLAGYIQTHNHQQKVFLYQNFEQLSSLVFFMQHPLPIIHSKSKDLYFGQHTPQAQGWFYSNKAFKHYQYEHPSIVIVRPSNLTNFLQAMKPLKFHIVKKFPRALIVAD